MRRADVCEFAAVVQCHGPQSRDRVIATTLGSCASAQYNFLVFVTDTFYWFYWGHLIWNLKLWETKGNGRRILDAFGSCDYCKSINVNRLFRIIYY